jgi:sigma-B regulation protein RsbU (phosphoserine phosphatase)
MSVESNLMPQGAALDSSILRVLMDTIPDQIYFKDLQSRFVRNNAAHARALGAASPDECLGKTDYDFFAHIHAEHAFTDEVEILRTGKSIIGQVERVMRLDGSIYWGSTTKLPWRDETGRIIGTFGLTRNITDLKRAEDQLTTERNLLRTIVDHLPSRIFVKDTNFRYILNNRAHLDGLGVPAQEDALGRTTLDFHPGERGLQALADDRQVLAGGPSILNQEKSDFGREGHVHWSLTTKVPLRDSHGKISGIVGISHDITRRKLAEEELQHRASEMEADLRMARQVQEAFLPRSYPVFPRGVPADSSALRFAHHYIPATTLGGDFFHIVQISDSLCGVLVCDVMGHGVRAGLLTALIRGVIEEMDERIGSPIHVLSEINRSLCPLLAQTGEPIFATLFYGVIDTSTATLTYANAGHPPPMIRRAGGGPVETLSSPSPEPAAGLISEFAYSAHVTTFSPGDAFVGETDGLFEASDDSGAMFGEARLRLVVEQYRDLGGSELIEQLIREVVAFTGRAAFEDDICVLVIESTGNLCVIRPGLTYEI